MLRLIGTVARVRRLHRDPRVTTVVVFESGFHIIVAVRIATFAKSIRTILLTGTSEQRAQSVRAVLAGERSFPSSLLVADASHVQIVRIVVLTDTHVEVQSRQTR